MPPEPPANRMNDSVGSAREDDIEIELTPIAQVNDCICKQKDEPSQVNSICEEQKRQDPSVIYDDPEHPVDHFEKGVLEQKNGDLLVSKVIASEQISNSKIAPIDKYCSE